jgi:hypothetical protein
MSKFLLNLLQISKALVNSKNPIFNSEILFLISARPTLRPTRPLAQPAHWLRRPSRPTPSRPAHPTRASVASSREIHLPFWFAPSQLAASPTSLCQRGPSCQFHPPPPAARAGPCHHRSSATERRPAPRLGCHRTITTSPSFPLPYRRG